MTEEIRKAVIRAISERFQMPVYGQTVPQGGKKPCFTVELAEMEQKRLLGRRAARKIVFEIKYFCGERNTQAAKVSEVADGLYEILQIIGQEETFAAGNMHHEKTKDGVKFTVAYEYHLIFEEDTELMERLEHNGRRLVGYEEESDIQQKTADGE